MITEIRIANQHLRRALPTSRLSKIPLTRRRTDKVKHFPSESLHFSVNPSVTRPLRVIEQQVSASFDFRYPVKGARNSAAPVYENQVKKVVGKAIDHSRVSME